MKFSELQKKDNKELMEMLSKSRERLKELRFQASSRKLRKVQDIKDERRQVARILTLLNKKEK
jgi:ribosomal protein L29